MRTKESPSILICKGLGVLYQELREETNVCVHVFLIISHQDMRVSGLDLIG